MHTLPDLKSAQDQTILDVFWETLDGLARDCGQTIDPDHIEYFGNKPNEQLSELISAAAGVTVEVHQGLLIGPISHIEALYRHCGSEEIDTWPNQGDKRPITLSLILQELQRRMSNGQILKLNRLVA